MTNETYEKLPDYYKSFIKTWEKELCLLDKGLGSVWTNVLHYEKIDEDTIEVVTDELKQMTLRKNLYFSMFDHIDKEDGKIHRTVFAYKYKHQLPLIKYGEDLQRILRESPLGKILKYSDELKEDELYRQIMSCFKANDVSNKKEDVKMEKKINIGGVFEKAFEDCSNELWNVQRCTNMIIQFVVSVMESQGKGKLGEYLDVINMFSTGRPIGTIAVRVPKKYFIHPNVRFNLISQLEKFGFLVEFEPVGGAELMVRLVINRLAPKYDAFEDIEKGLKMVSAEGDVKGEVTAEDTASSSSLRSDYFIDPVGVSARLDRAAHVETKDAAQMGEIKIVNNLSKTCWDRRVMKEKDLPGGKDDKCEV